MVAERLSNLSTDFLVLSQEMPQKKSKNSNGKPLSWDKVVAKLIVSGIPIEQIRKMTRKQAYNALDEVNERMKFDIRLAGGKVEDDEDQEMTLQDILGLG